MMKLALCGAAVISALLLSGCKGESTLPSLELVGKTRAEVVALFATGPRSDSGKIQLFIGELDECPCTATREYFTVKSCLDDATVLAAPRLGGWIAPRRGAFPRGWDHYEVEFGADDRVEAQRVGTYFGW